MALLKAVTKYGAVTGIRGNNRSFSVFRGIPFAKPPVGDLRFAAPEPPEPWQGERPCDKWPRACIQPSSNLGHNHFGKEFYAEPVETSEDCLYLNVWTPAGSPEERLPVMLWIHGGGFGTGYSYEQEFDGEAMNKRGVILVTCAYRCNVLGFLAHPALAERDPHHATGNYGILDQIAALTWVKENIAAFGGDPDNITVFGQSAGGISTRILMLSPLSRRLFRRAIVQSGGGVTDADPTRTSQEKGEICARAMETLGWTVEDLFRRDANELQRKLTQAVNEVLEHRVMLFFQPCIDGYSILDVPGKSIAAGGAEGFDVLCGTVTDDAWMFAHAALEDSGMDGFQRKKRAYAFSPSVSWAQNTVRRGGKPIYTYFFEHNIPGDENGAWHAGDIWYAMGTMYRCWRPWTGYDYELSDMMADYWTNFAKGGDPNGPGLPMWPPYTAEQPLTMDFSDEGAAAVNLVCGEMERRIVDYMEAHPGLLCVDPGI